MDLRVPMPALPVLKVETVVITKIPPAAPALMAERRWVLGWMPRMDLVLERRRSRLRFWFEDGQIRIGFPR